jgi:hypothetical protein
MVRVIRVGVRVKVGVGARVRVRVTALTCPPFSRQKV